MPTWTGRVLTVMLNCLVTDVLTTTEWIGGEAQIADVNAIKPPTDTDQCLQIGTGLWSVTV